MCCDVININMIIKLVKSKASVIKCSINMQHFCTTEKKQLMMYYQNVSLKGGSLCRLTVVFCLISNMFCPGHEVGIYCISCKTTGS